MPMFETVVLGPAVDPLAVLAEGGPALELGMGTGRVALPLAERGVVVHGIKLSASMVGRAGIEAVGRSEPQKKRPGDPYWVLRGGSSDPRRIRAPPPIRSPRAPDRLCFSLRVTGR